jgi:hypothetical protein
VPHGEGVRRLVMLRQARSASLAVLARPPPSFGQEVPPSCVAGSREYAQYEHVPAPCSRRHQDTSLPGKPCLARHRVARGGLAGTWGGSASLWVKAQPKITQDAAGAVRLPARRGIPVAGSRSNQVASPERSFAAYRRRPEGSRVRWRGQ